MTSVQISYSKKGKATNGNIKLVVSSAYKDYVKIGDFLVLKVL